MRLDGQRWLISAGPTFEDIDPVRFIGNRSSGKMGFAIAAEAARRGAHVVLVAGPVHLPTPEGVERVNVRSAAQMHAAVMAALPADVYVGAAAVADFSLPAATRKLKKAKGQTHLTLTLERTPDILADVAAHPARPRQVIGFAAESEDLAAYARDKLTRKGADLICANLIGQARYGFESDDNALLLVWADGQAELAPASKTALASTLLDFLQKNS